MSELRALNTRAPRIDAPAKACGQAKFTDDFSMPGMLYAAILQSPLAHARILHIDTSRALKLPGVKAVATAKDAGLVKYGVSPARYDETLFRWTRCGTWATRSLQWRPWTRILHRRHWT